jgi:hypothetical protein
MQPAVALEADPVAKNLGMKTMPMVWTVKVILVLQQGSRTTTKPMAMAVVPAITIPQESSLPATMAVAAVAAVVTVRRAAAVGIYPTAGIVGA